MGNSEPASDLGDKALVEKRGAWCILRTAGRLEAWQPGRTIKVRGHYEVLRTS